MPSPLRIVAVADTHLFHDDLDPLPEGDVFIHAGDLCRGGGFDELVFVAAWLRKLPHPTKIVVAGNHDRAFQSDLPRVLELLGPDIIYLEDREHIVSGLRIWGSPWQPELRNWAFNLPRGEPLAAKWRQIPTGIDILITHGPPLGIGDDSGDARRRGCHDLRQELDRIAPRLHLFGHIHQAGGTWHVGGTLCANVTTWEGERGASVFEFDAASRAVQAVEIPPRTVKR